MEVPFHFNVVAHLYRCTEEVFGFCIVRLHTASRSCFTFRYDSETRMINLDVSANQNNSRPSLHPLIYFFRKSKLEKNLKIHNGKDLL